LGNLAKEALGKVKPSRIAVRMRTREKTSTESDRDVVGEGREKDNQSPAPYSPSHQAKHYC
jgi:hypothetical protein